tara:strand:- start:407 stop:922 length:516 start_codon:yes stop_codon:yes gene_type:complete
MGNEAFKAALSYAMDSGAINSDTQVDESLSGYKSIYYELRDEKGKIICRIPLEIVEITEAETREKAVLWAKSMGYPIPNKMGGCLSVILIIIGLFVYVFPGILILLLVWYQAKQYKRDMRQLVARWVDAGKPTPGKKEILERPLEIVLEQNNKEEIEQKLKEIRRIFWFRR